MDELARVVVAGLAAWQVVEVWRHSALMAGPRARVEARPGFVPDLLSCPFCLSVWAGAACYAALLAGSAPAAWWNLFGLPAFAASAAVCGLAASRLANLGNDLSHDRCRTPREDKSL